MTPEEAAESLRVLDEVGAVSPAVYRRALTAVIELHGGRDVAWLVRLTDEDNRQAYVVYATTALRAAKAAESRSSENLISGGELAEGVTVERAPQWDAMAPHGPDAGQLIRDGWEFECWHCQHRVSCDGCPDCESDGSPSDVVTRGDGVWCSAVCRDAYDAERRVRREMCDAARAALLARWPFAEIREASAILVDGKEVALVEFTFPGATSVAKWVNGADSPSVAKVDFDAWRAAQSGERP